MEISIANTVLRDKCFQNIRQEIIKLQDSSRNNITKASQIIKELEWINLPIRILEYGNEYKLSAFQY
jgi:hypothetical protein